MTLSIPQRHVLSRSRLFAWLTLGLAAVLVLLDVLVWMDMAALRDGAAAHLPPGTAHDVTPVALFGGFVAAHLVLGLLLYALWQAYRLFSAFSEGAILVPATGRRLFRVGLAFLLILPAKVIGTGVTSVLLTWNNPPGERALALTVDPADAMLGAAGLLILTVGWVMGEAARIADDHAQIV